MSEKDVTKFLQILGLSKEKFKSYMFLAKSGVQSTSFVAKRLKMERVPGLSYIQETAGKRLHRSNLRAAHPIHHCCV